MAVGNNAVRYGFAVKSGSIKQAIQSVGQAFRHEGGHRLRLANIAHLLTGNVLGSLLGLVAFALSARALGLESYGQLALVLTFTRVIERIVSFQSWQPIIKYGASLTKPEQRDDLRAILKFGLLLDIGSALCAWVVALTLVFGAAWFLGWSEETVRLLMLYSTVLLFQISGMSTAVLRMAGKFRLLAYGQLVTTLLRVALCWIGFMLGAGLIYFALVWGVTQILGSATRFILAIRTLRQQGVRGVLRAPMKGVTARFPGLWNFAWSSNLSLTLRMSTQEVDTLLVGALADPAAAGLYHIAKRFGRFGQQVGVQAQAVLYPDVVRIWASGRIDELKRVVLHTELVLLAFGIAAILILFVMIDPLIVWTAGREFIGAANLAVVQMVAVALVISGSAARAALLGMGRQREVLRIVIVATMAFHVTAVLLIPEIGPMGGSIAHIVLGIIWVVGLSILFRQTIKAAGLSREGSASALACDLAVSKGI
ncbi:lipopolysaccharide biosynthesis protein [Allomesorhizobium camelthorni]|uniref:Lipopolysaccharide biosynthesis protein n=1 Tax=Allomesorhizobium camelthorni TaxID=475069 RepID=A0A6G4WJE1_9HYPH|nr:lipopolysaccharide biosynthesis protein [Mesorhizobium camelthorni]NGO54313.1 lipopolysaccharide biosynthesis protein [Mesorhizobium camelthorni]